MQQVVRLRLLLRCLYEKYGEEVTVYNYEYDPRIKEWSVDTIQGTRIVSSLYLTPLDNWENLESDLKRVLDYPKSSMYGSSICAYAGMQDAHFCDDCKLLKDKYCIVGAFYDIFNSHSQFEGRNP